MCIWTMRHFTTIERCCSFILLSCIEFFASDCIEWRKLSQKSANNSFVQPIKCNFTHDIFKFCMEWKGSAKEIRTNLFFEKNFIQYSISRKLYRPNGIVKYIRIYYICGVLLVSLEWNQIRFWLLFYHKYTYVIR